MSKTKKLVIASVFLIFIGLIFSIIGSLNGGLGYIQSNKFFLNLSNKYNEPITKTEDLSPFKDIDISSEYCTVEIINSDKFSIDYSYTDEKNLPVYSVTDGKLNLTAKPAPKAVNFSLIQQEASIKVYVPGDQALNNIKINSTSSNVILKGFKSSNIDIKNEHGNTNISDLKCDTMNIDTESGNLKIANVSTTKDTTVHSTHGNVSIDSSNLNKLNSILSSGNFESRYLISENASIQSTHGDIDLNNTKTNGLNLTSESSNINVSGNLLNDTNIKSTHGTIDLYLDQPLENYNYNTKSKHGTTKINDETFEGNSKVLGSAKNTITASSDSGDINLNFKRK